MMHFLYKFIRLCDSAKITPCERDIDAFLQNLDRLDLREKFIKFCFYNWEQRKNKKIMNALKKALN